MAKQGDNDRGVNLNASNVLLNSLQLEHNYIIIDNKVMQVHYVFLLHKANVSIGYFHNP